MSDLIIGITGGIGSGKSVVAKILCAMHYPVYDSDLRAREMYFNAGVKKEIIDLLGAESYLSETSINKTYIANKIFGDTRLLEKVNAIIHPAVKQDFDTWKKKHAGYKILFKESAILFETGIYKNCDKTILVTAPEEVRIERVKQRDGLTGEEVEKKIKSQLPDKKKMELADFVIDNSGEKLVIPQVIEILDRLNKTS